MTTATRRPVDVRAVPTLDHQAAMVLAETEAGRVLAVVDDLSAADWAASTECPGWTVKDVLGHLLGMWELQYDPAERARQLAAADQAAARSGRLPLDELTALQVAEHTRLSTEGLARALHDAAPRGLAARRALPAAVRAAPYDPQLPGESPWTLGYLFDVIFTRDPWMHRIDICRAIGTAPLLTSEHDGRLVADVVAEWARRHAQPVTLELTGPAGGRYTAGEGGESLALDAVEFCRILSGRAEASGLLAVHVPF
jgi:uncharacterized protein (TIGR03083 family)